MRIVRPYGDSRTKFENETLVRALHRGGEDAAREAIEPFAHEHHDLVIAQWISMIDKIASKPSGKDGATDRQRDLRAKLGGAAWSHMIAKGQIKPSETETKRLEVLWANKVHPYGTAQYRPRKRKDGSEAPEPNPRGRWYSRFVGDVGPEDIDAVRVIQEIEDHLYTAAKRLHPGLPDRDLGHIQNRAASIARNTVALRSERSAKNRIALPEHWSDADEDAYFRKADVAKEIFEAAKAHEEDSFHPFRLSAAAKILQVHWVRVFGAEVKHFREVPEDKRGMLAFHVAVKEAYRTKLKRRKAPVKSKKDTRSPEKLSPASFILPKFRRQLSELVRNQDKNRRVADLIRRGKLVHYTANDQVGHGDEIEVALRAWPGDLSSSRFRTSAGQAEIKRAEAFVRIWRHTISLSALTVRDWASMKAGDIEDPFANANKPSDAVKPANFDEASHDRKVRLLFGGRAALFEDDASSRTGLLSSVMRIGIELRNAGFHFKGRGGFVRAFEGIAKASVTDDVTLTNARKLWDKDIAGRSARLREALVAVDADRFFDKLQLATIVDQLEGQTDDIAIPLPRFRRVLLRVDNTWKGRDALDLPGTSNRTDMENQPALRCRYVVLKNLYEGPFRSWTQSQNAETVTKWITRSIERSDLAAKDMNGGQDEDKRLIIEGKAAAMLKGRSWELMDFLEALSRATASEMQVQKGYGHDGEAAREQSRYIDDVLCDVMALGFEAWIKEMGLSFVVKLDPAKQTPAQVNCDIGSLPTSIGADAAEDWQIALYLFLHTVPVGEVGRLLHQLAKWEITASREAELSSEEGARLRALSAVLKLYLAMHDAKFEGGDALTGIEDFQDFFESQPGFAKIFPAQSDSLLDRRVPRRGLREIMRFGHHSLIQTLGQHDKITDREVDDYLRVEGGEGKDSLAGFQKQREDLHAEWVDTKGRSFGPDKRRRYAEAVVKVSKHRQLAHRATLTDQLQLHSVMMSVLGRLVDYSGLFERDLYFVTLGLLHEKGLSPSDVMKGDPNGQETEYFRGMKMLSAGRIFAALNKEKMLKKQPDGSLVPEAQSLLDSLEQLFGEPAGRPLLGPGMTLQGLRNDFAHFNWLHDQRKPLNLTDIANQTRILVSYDRKLKNSVSKSIKELLVREGFYLSWTMPNHVLGNATIASKQAVHLGGQVVENRSNQRRLKMVENLKSRAALKGLATLFGGAVDDSSKDMSDWNLDLIDWDRQSRKGGRSSDNNGRNRGKSRHSKGQRDQKTRYSW